MVPAPSAEPEPARALGPPPEDTDPQEPKAFACRLQDKSWSFDQLRLRTAGKVFAAAVSAPVTLVFGLDSPPKRAVAVLDDGQVEIRLVIQAPETPIYTRAAARLSGFLIPAASRSLDWLGGESGKLRVSVGARDVLVSPERVEGSLACDALGITAGKFDGRASITRQKQLPKQWVVRDGAELALEAGGKPVARLVEQVEAEVLARKAGSTRVLLAGFDYWVVGWMATRDLTWTPSMTGILGGAAKGGVGAQRAGQVSVRRCEADVELFGVLGGEHARIGTIRRGTPFVLRDEKDGRQDEPLLAGLRQISLFNPWLQLDAGARLMVAESATKQCSATSAWY